MASLSLRCEPLMDRVNYIEMKKIMFNLSEYLNCPDENLERMIGTDWYQFNKLLHRLSVEDNKRNDALLEQEMQKLLE